MYKLLEEFMKELAVRPGRKKDAAMAKALLSYIEPSDRDEEVIATLEDELRFSKAKKEKKFELLLEFYAFCEKKTGRQVVSDLKNHKVIDDPILRRAGILRYFQDHECKTEDIAEVFMLDRRTASTDLRALEDGVDLLNATMQLDLKRNGWKYYTECSSHPVLLNLDIPEVIAMTAGLMKLSEKEPLYAPQYQKIAREVYDGLSDYAKGKILRYMKDQQVESGFTEEMEMYKKQVSSALITMLKAQCPGTVKLSHEGKEYVFADCHLTGYSENEIMIVTSEGQERSFFVSDVFACEYHLERKFEG